MKHKGLIIVFLLSLFIRIPSANTNLAIQSTNVNIKGQSESSGDVEIVSHSYYVEMGYSNIVGEVQNTCNNNLEYVELVMIFYDKDNNVISTAFTFTQLDILMPQEKSPFVVSSFPDENLNVEHYKVVVGDYFITSSKPYREQNIQGVTTGVEYGYFTLRGEIKNSGEIDVTFVEVIATFYDEKGTVVGSSFTFTNPEDIGSGKAAPFEMTTFPREFTPASYSLQVESSETILDLQVEPSTVLEPEPSPSPSPSPSPAPEEKPEDIPGFPYEAIILGLVTGVFILWMLQRKQ